MPDAGRTRKPCVQKEMHFAHASKTGQPKQPALPAQWCYGLYAPSPVSGLFSHRRLAHRSQGLIPASGRGIAYGFGRLLP